MGGDIPGRRFDHRHAREHPQPHRPRKGGHGAAVHHGVGRRTGRPAQRVLDHVHGSLSSATIGYWVAKEMAGRGITPTAVALATDHCFLAMRLHRMEICIRPDNGPSLRVVEKLGFRYEGLRRRFIHIDGDWRDHFAFALVAEEVPGGVLRRWREGRAPSEAAIIPTADREAALTPFGWVIMTRPALNGAAERP